MIDIFNQKDNLLKLNFKNEVDGITLLNSLKNNSIKVFFYDPQYRGILDKMSYGNEGKSRGKDRCALEQMSEETISKFLTLISEKLVPSGYLFLWVDKFHLVEGINGWIENIPILHCVDMITWDKMKIGMGYRTRRKSEHLVIIQKHPKLAKATWKKHDIPDVWSEKIAKKIHTHQKPIELQKQLILATTEKGDVVCDPCAGSFSVLEACKAPNIDFIGGDIKVINNEN